MTTRNLTSLQHPIVKHFVHVRQNHDYREEYQSAIVAGEKEVREIGAQFPIKALFVYDESAIPKDMKAKEIYVVTEEIMQKASGLRAPEGFLAEVSLPESSSLKGAKRVLVLDKINDPGNLGSLLRTALALGWDGAFILNDSCDPYNDKALRAARGATFRLPIGRGSWNDFDRIIESNQLEVYSADIKGNPASSLKPQNALALVLGNETHGISEEAKTRSKTIAIPMPGMMESLNVSVAGGILMYVFKGA